MTLNPRALARHLRAMRETIDGLLCDLETAAGDAPKPEPAPDPLSKIRTFGNQPSTSTGASHGSEEVEQQ